MKKKHFLFFAVLSLSASCHFNDSQGKKRDVQWAGKVADASLHNLYRLNDSLYRSEQPDANDLQYISTLGIRSILNLRSNHEDSVLPGAQRFNTYHVKFVTKHFTDTEMVAALRIIRKAPKPLLVHCKHGSDRTGVVMAMYRVLFEHWTKEKAIDELKNGQYGFHTRYDNIPEYIMNADVALISKLVFDAKNE
jgi:tyrosine-protein phosphatase SIW14